MLFYVSLGLPVLWVIVAAVRDASRKRNSRMPPGPPPLPLLGNLLEIPTTFYKRLHSWSERYGPVVTFWIGTQPCIAISEIGAAADILDRMSGITSERPPMIKARQFFLREGWVMLQDHSTLLWRANRRAIHANLNVRSAQRFVPMQEQEAAYTTLALLQYPDKQYHSHMHRFAASIIYRALYGGPAIGHNDSDPLKKIEDLGVRMMAAAAPQNSVVDNFPFLLPLIRRVKWLRNQADQWNAETDTEGVRLYEAAMQRESSGVTTIVHDFEANGEKYGLRRHDAVWATMALYVAGQETTHTTLRVLALALLHYPDVMRKAQKHLDAVCGDRPPTFADRDNLPHIDAICKEAVRWKPALVASIPHLAAQEFTYQGYAIPQGTMIFDNIWSQTRDTSVYTNPETFDPTRFLDASGKLDISPTDTHSGLIPFGHGRRVCPGKDLATNSLFIACAYMLWAFDFHWPVDEHGKEVTMGPEDLFDHGVIVTPKSFGVVLKPRHSDLEEKLLRAAKQ